MQFRAKINRVSHIYRAWAGGGKPVGALGDVVFRYVEGGDFYSGILTPDQVVAMDVHPHVSLEAAADTASLNRLCEMASDPKGDVTNRIQVAKTPAEHLPAAEPPEPPKPPPTPSSAPVKSRPVDPLLAAARAPADRPISPANWPKGKRR